MHNRQTQWTVQLQSGRVAALTAAVLFLIPSIMSVFLYFDWTGGPSYPDYNAGPYTSRLDPLYLKRVWEWRRENFGFILSLDMFAAVALLISIYPIFCLKQILKWGATFLKNLMVYSYLIGALLPALEFLQNMGSYSQAHDMIPEIDDIDTYVSLEISWRLSQAASVWVFSLIYVFLGFSILCASFLFLREEQFRSKSHAYFGFFTSGVALVTFTVEISAFFDHHDIGIRYAFGLFTLFWGVICLPLWFVILAIRIGSFRAMEAVEVIGVPAGPAAVASQQQQPQQQQSQTTATTVTPQRTAPVRSVIGRGSAAQDTGRHEDIEMSPTRYHQDSDSSSDEGGVV